MGGELFAWKKHLLHEYKKHGDFNEHQKAFPNFYPNGGDPFRLCDHQFRFCGRLRFQRDCCAG
jgi:hypothetical protein